MSSKFELQVEKKGGELIVLEVESFSEAYQKTNELKTSPELTGKVFLWGGSNAGWAFMISHGVDYYFLDFRKGGDFVGKKV